MANQINVDNQFSNQNQSLLSQPIVEKPKLNHWMISTLVLFMILVIGGLYTLNLRANLLRDWKIKKTTTTLAPSPTAISTLNGTMKWKVYNNPNPKYTIKYPSDWQLDSSEAVLTAGNSEIRLSLTLTKGNYKFKVSGVPEGAVCLFKGDPLYEGPASSIIEDYVEIESPHYLFRRVPIPQGLYDYYNVPEGYVHWYICQKEWGTHPVKFKYFVAPTILSMIHYTAPKNYDLEIIKEMDEILKTVYVDPNIAISEKRALELVTNLPEVKEFLSKKPWREWVEGAGEVEHQRSYSLIPWKSDPGVLWIIEVYERLAPVYRADVRLPRNVFGTYEIRVNPEKVTKR